MPDSVFIVLISAGGSIVIGLTALVLNFRLFISLDRRIDVIETDLRMVLERPTVTGGESCAAFADLEPVTRPVNPPSTIFRITRPAAGDRKACA